MIERRKLNRRRCLLGARVVFKNRSLTLNCTLRNFSDSGALLKFDGFPDIPDKLEMILGDRTTLMPVHIAWRKNDTVGVSFPRGDFMAEVRDNARGKVTSFQVAPVGETLH